MHPGTFLIRQQFVSLQQVAKTGIAHVREDFQGEIQIGAEAECRDRDGDVAAVVLHGGNQAFRPREPGTLQNPGQVGVLRQVQQPILLASFALRLACQGADKDDGLTFGAELPRKNLRAGMIATDDVMAAQAADSIRMLLFADHGME